MNTFAVSCHEPSLPHHDNSSGFLLSARSPRPHVANCTLQPPSPFSCLHITVNFLHMLGPCLPSLLGFVCPGIHRRPSLSIVSHAQSPLPSIALILFSSATCNPVSLPHSPMSHPASPYDPCRSLTLRRSLTPRHSLTLRRSLTFRRSPIIQCHTFHCPLTLRRNSTIHRPLTLHRPLTYCHSPSPHLQVLLQR